MTAYDVFVEAHGYGDPAEEVESLEGALEEAGLGEDVSYEVLGDDVRGMLLVHLKVEAINAVDAHELGLTVWQDAWGAAFADQAPTEMLAIRCVPVSAAASNGATP